MKRLNFIQRNFKVPKADQISSNDDSRPSCSRGTKITAGVCLFLLGSAAAGGAAYHFTSQRGELGNDTSSTLGFYGNRVDFLLQNRTTAFWEEATTPASSATTTYVRTTKGLLTTVRKEATTPASSATTTSARTTTGLLTTVGEEATTPASSATTTSARTTKGLLTTVEEETTTPASSATNTSARTTTGLLTTVEEEATTPASSATTTSARTTTGLLTTVEEETSSPLTTASRPQTIPTLVNFLRQSMLLSLLMPEESATSSPAPSTLSKAGERIDNSQARRTFQVYQRTTSKNKSTPRPLLSPWGNLGRP